MLNAEKREQLRAILHQSPRTFGQPASVWTLKRLAAVCHEQGLSDTTLSCPTMLDAIVRLGVSWQRAKHWIVSPDPAYEEKKRRDRLIQMAANHPDLVLGFEDEVWWSREAQPQMHAWSDDKPVRLVEKTVPAKDPEGKAVACYGLYVRKAGKGPGSGKPLAVEGGEGHATQPNRGRCRLIVCRLPSKSPWLNPIEPKWVHGKRAVVEPARVLSMTELMQRVCAYYQCELTDPIAQPDC